MEAIRAELQPEDRVFAPDRFSDWLLWEIPELRGRVSYDVRFELYDEEFFDELQEYAGESTDDWKSFADGYRIVVVDETRRSHTDGLPRGAGRARDLPRRRAHGRSATGDLRDVALRSRTGGARTSTNVSDDGGEHRGGLERRPVVGAPS